MGAILIHQQQMASYPWTVLSRGWGAEQAYLRNDPKLKLQLAFWITFEVASKLFASSGLDIEKVMDQMRQRGAHALPLDATAKAHIISNVRDFDGQNVIARLQGGDTARSREAVLYTAHHDHFGIVHAEGGDKIFPGAVDNATGVAMLLEVARVFTATRPVRSILFATVDAEEQGLLGSQYLAEHPPLPTRNIVLNLNFEGLFIMPVGVPEELQVSGAGRTTFYPEVQQVAREFGMTIPPILFPKPVISIARTTSVWRVSACLPFQLQQAISLPDTIYRGEKRRQWISSRIATISPMTRTVQRWTSGRTRASRKLR